MIVRLHRPLAALAVAVVSLVACAGAANGSQNAPAQLPPASAPAQISLQLLTLPATPTAGQPVRLLVLGAPAGSIDFKWELNGDGAFARDSGSVGQTFAVFGSAGAHHVAVSFSAGGHAYTVASVLQVQPGQESKLPARHAWASQAHRATAGSGPGRGETKTFLRQIVAHAAADPGVAIVNFTFSPATTTVHVGDTITWSNSDSAPHTATAKDGSFDTGILMKGQSASHTFTHAGTFAYICSVHPYMHGTVVVLASATGASTSASSSPPSSSAPASTNSTAAKSPSTSSGATQASTAPALPLTGMNVLDGAATGLLLLGLGVALRKFLLC